MNTRSPTLLLAALAAGIMLAPAAAAGQGPSGLDRARAGLPADFADQLAALVRDAEQAGLPAGPLVDKTLEGEAKGIAADRILSVVRTLEAQLAEAHALLAAGPTTPAPAQVAGVADALRRGVPQSAIRELSVDADADVALEAHVVGDLMDRGVAVDDALGLLRAWRSHGRRVADLEALPAAVAALVRQGKKPGDAAAEVAASVNQGLGPFPFVPPGQGGTPPGLLKKGGPPIPPGAGPPTKKGKPGGSHH
jgi:hypothetical protein